METSDDNREKLQASNAANEIIYFNELTSFYRTIRCIGKVMLLIVAAIKSVKRSGHGGGGINT